MGYHNIIAQDFIALFCAQFHSSSSKCKKRKEIDAPVVLLLFAISFADLRNCYFLYSVVLDHCMTTATTKGVHFS